MCWMNDMKQCEHVHKNKDCGQQNSSLVHHILVCIQQIMLKDNSFRSAGKVVILLNIFRNYGFASKRIWLVRTIGPYAKWHGLPWRCIQCHEAHSALCSGLAGSATATERKPLEPASSQRSSGMRMSPSHSQAGLLSLQQSVRLRNQYYSIDIGAKRQHRWPARLQKLDYRVSWSERRGNCFLSYLFRSPGTIVLHSSGARTSPVFLTLLCTCLQDMRGVAHRSICICTCSYILLVATVQGTN